MKRKWDVDGVALGRGDKGEPGESEREMLQRWEGVTGGMG